MTQDIYLRVISIFFLKIQFRIVCFILSLLFCPLSTFSPTGVPLHKSGAESRLDTRLNHFRPCLRVWPQVSTPYQKYRQTRPCGDGFPAFLPFLMLECPNPSGEGGGIATAVPSPGNRPPKVSWPPLLFSLSGLIAHHPPPVPTEEIHEVRTYSYDLGPGLWGV